MSTETLSTCAVCLDELTTELAALACGHVLHYSCATQALRLFKQCPICRKRAKHAVRLFYSAGASALDVNASLAASSPASSPAPQSDSVPQTLTAFRKSIARLAAEQRMVSSRSFRLESENVRLRQDITRAAAQLDSMCIKSETQEKELRVWKRIATTAHSQLQDLKLETSASNLKLLASLHALKEAVQESPGCDSCSHVAKSSLKHLRALCEAVDSAATPRSRTRKMACCSAEQGSRALRAFCAHHSSAAAASPSP